jgi:hypothetical protein
MTSKQEGEVEQDFARQLLEVLAPAAAAATRPKAWWEDFTKVKPPVHIPDYYFKGYSTPGWGQKFNDFYYSNSISAGEIYVDSLVHEYLDPDKEYVFNAGMHNYGYVITGKLKYVGGGYFEATEITMTTKANEG